VDLFLHAFLTKWVVRFCKEKNFLTLLGIWLQLLGRPRSIVTAPTELSLFPFFVPLKVTILGTIFDWILYPNWNFTQKFRYPPFFLPCQLSNSEFLTWLIADGTVYRTTESSSGRSVWRRPPADDRMCKIGVPRIQGAQWTQGDISHELGFEPETRSSIHTVAPPPPLPPPGWRVSSGLLNISLR
jgi:hypothetical protein